MNAYFFSNYSANNERDRKRRERERLLVRSECARRQWTYNIDANFFATGQNTNECLIRNAFKGFVQATEDGHLVADPVLVLTRVDSLNFLAGPAMNGGSRHECRALRSVA